MKKSSSRCEAKRFGSWYWDPAGHFPCLQKRTRISSKRELIFQANLNQIGFLPLPICDHILGSWFSIRSQQSGGKKDMIWQKKSLPGGSSLQVVQKDRGLNISPTWPPPVRSDKPCTALAPNFRLWENLAEKKANPKSFPWGKTCHYAQNFPGKKTPSAWMKPFILSRPISDFD